MAEKKKRSNEDDSRFNQGPPGMTPDGELNTIGPDGKPTHPIRIYMPDGRVLTAEEYMESEPDISDLEEQEEE